MERAVRPNRWCMLEAGPTYLIERTNEPSPSISFQTIYRSQDLFGLRGAVTRGPSILQPLRDVNGGRFQGVDERERRT